MGKALLGFITMMLAANLYSEVSVICKGSKKSVFLDIFITIFKHFICELCKLDFKVYNSKH